MHGNSLSVFNLTVPPVARLDKGRIGDAKRLCSGTVPLNCSFLTAHGFKGSSLHAAPAGWGLASACMATPPLFSLWQCQSQAWIKDEGDVNYLCFDTAPAGCGLASSRNRVRVEIRLRIRVWSDCNIFVSPAFEMVLDQGFVRNPLFPVQRQRPMFPLLPI